MSKMTTCPNCGKSLIHYRMKKHIQVIHGDKKWFCNKCDKKYNQEDNLQRHIRVINEGHREICPHCEKPLKSELSNQCDFCPFKGKQKRYILEHVKKEHPSKKLNEMRWKKSQ